MKIEVSDRACALCGIEAGPYPIREGENQFCCAGCRAVFHILSSKKEMEGFEQHPLFLQALRSGLISNPALLEHIHSQRDAVGNGEREKLYLEIAEMWCPSCAEIIRLILLKQKGVLNCTVDYATDLASVEFSPLYLSKERILEIIQQFGYRPLPIFDQSARKAAGAGLYLRFIIAAFCSLNLMMLAYPLYATYFSYDGEGYGALFVWLSFFCALPVVFYSGWPVWRRFFNSLFTGFFGMETLVAIGVGAAFALSLYEMWQGGTRVYFDSMSVIIVFVLLGKIIEAKAKFSAKESLLRLNRSTPRRGRKRFGDGKERFVPVKEIVKGDILVAYQGEKIALDGVVCEGEGACDESLMTGEAIPIVKRAGQNLLGGTLLVAGQLAYQVTSDLEETALHKIIQMVEGDIGHKTAYVRAADQIVRWFVPAVVALAVLTFMWAPPETAWLRALAVLLISCPCAIGIAAPTAESHLLNNMAALGAIVRNRGCLAHFGKETVMVFDKTGTVTEGRFAVRKGLEQLDSEDRAALHALASKSTHPVACAIASACPGQSFPIAQMEEVSGYGLRGIINESLYIMGSSRFLSQMGVVIPEDMSTEVFMTAVYVAKERRFLTRLLLQDQIRPEIKEILTHLYPVRPLLLSGDSEGPVAMTAKACGFASWKSCCSPLDKREFIAALRRQGEIVAMVGDGINDAPALTAAHIGISVVSATDMSIQVSDLLLTTDRLHVLVKLRNLAAKGRKIVKQNLFWAFFYNLIGLFLAAGGMLSPIFAAIAMSLSSITVLFNARRININKNNCL